MNIITLSVLDYFFIYSSVVRIKAYLRLPKRFAIVRFLCKMLHERTYRIERIIRLIYEKLLKCIWNKVVIKSSKWQLKHQNWTTTLLMLLCYYSFAWTQLFYKSRRSFFMFSDALDNIKIIILVNRILSFISIFFLDIWLINTEIQFH